jgi:hypothetical protein
MSELQICKICSGSIELISQAVILDKYTVAYFSCLECGLIQTESPYWLPEAYSAAITSSDIGMVSRNIALAKITKPIISVFFGSSGKFLDYGGGYGLYVRMMRDYGFDFFWYDKYCQNTFAVGFEAKVEDRFELLTAFEIFEHLADPVAELESLLVRSRNVLFSTELVPDGNPKPGEWWYYGLEHGQHISFYRKKTLIALANKFKLNCYSDGNSLHLFTEKTISERLFRLICHNFVARKAIDFTHRTKSLIEEDYLKITGSKR